MLENSYPTNAIADTRNVLPTVGSSATVTLVGVPIAPRPSPCEINQDATSNQDAAMPCPGIIPSGQESTENIARLATEEKMASAATEVLGGSQSVREKMGEFMKAATTLAGVIPGDAELHCFITCKGNLRESPADREQLFPLKSNLFHSALHASQRGCTVAGQALRDAFLIARRVSQGRFYFDAPSMPSVQSLPGDNIPALALPSWLPYRASGSLELSEGTNSSRPIYIICKNNVMEGLSRLGVQKVAESYSKFFNTLWETGSNQGRVGGRRTYAQMTPPWLRQNTIFIYGENRNSSIPFTHGVLPNKNAIRQRSNKILGCAILDTFLRREEPCRPFLQHLLQEAGLRISDNTERENSNIEQEAIPRDQPESGNLQPRFNDEN